MNLKQPYRLASVMTLGMTALGYACWEIPNPDLFRGPDWKWLVMGVGSWLMVIGFWGFIASLIWWFIATIISFIRSRNQKRFENH
jgi:hypothetical protein